MSGRRVLIIEGSPRRAGNSSTLAAEVAAGALDPAEAQRLLVDL